MKKIKVSFIFGCLAILLCLIGLSGCSKDNEEEYKAYYHGNIVSVSQDTHPIYIKVTYSPNNTNEWPRAKDELSVKQVDNYPIQDFKENHEVIFSIVSAKAGFGPSLNDFRYWNNVIIKVIKVK